MPETSLKVIALPFVKQAIAELKRPKIHPFFLPYLVLRRHSVLSGSRENLTPNWKEEVGKLLALNGGPPTKPYYRPFFDQDVRDESRYWMNRNLAGSYAPSSIRRLAGEFVSGSGRNYDLSEDHFQRAAASLISNTPVNAYAFSAFLFREYGFRTGDAEERDVLVEALRTVFGFDHTPQGDKDFRRLFSVQWNDFPQFAVFDEVEPSVENERPAGPDRELRELGEGAAITFDPIRELTADDLGIGYVAFAPTGHATNDPSAEVMADDDALLITVTRLLEQFGGVIFSGPPGTSKSYFAGLIASKISGGEPSRSRYVQFHASYQYEDFMEGFAPAEDGSGFHLKGGHFVNICRDADKDPDQTYVLVIDELSRADVGRVFGEALTYIEKSKRGIPFSLPSGRTISVPKNLLLIMTMNPMDKGVDEVDAAFERRFAKVSLDPDAKQLAQILETNGVEAALISRIIAWFRATNGRANEVPQAALGHAYFSSVVDEFTLRDVWAYQLRHHVERAFRYDPSTRDEVIAGWQRVFRDIPGGWDGNEEQSAPAASASPSASGQ